MVKPTDLEEALQKAVTQLLTTHKLADMTLKQGGDLNRYRQILGRISNENRVLATQILNSILDRKHG